MAKMYRLHPLADQ